MLCRHACDNHKNLIMAVLSRENTLKWDSWSQGWKRIFSRKKNSSVWYSGKLFDFWCDIRCLFWLKSDKLVLSHIFFLFHLFLLILLVHFKSSLVTEDRLIYCMIKQPKHWNYSFWLLSKVSVMSHLRFESKILNNTS